MNILSDLTKFSSSQITSSDTFKDFFGEFLKYIELSLKTPQTKIDIDKLDDSFIDNYKRIYMSNVPDTNPIKSLNNKEIKRVLKDIVSVNKNKGVIETIEYMFRTIYGEFDIKISSGINSAVVEYKPDDYTVEFVDNNFNTIPEYNFNSLSNQPFTFVDDPTIRGFVVTIFDGNHLWVDKLYGKVLDGDILYFPNLNSYVRVITTNKLELDGWKDKNKRYKVDYFYSQSKINNKLFSVYKEELYGYDYLNNASIEKHTFGDPDNGNGYIDDLVLYFTSGVNDSTQNVDYSIIVDDVTYNVNIEINVTNRKSVLKINGNVIDIPLSDRIVYRLSAYEFLDNSGNPIVNKDIIDYRIARISFFTYIIETKLKPDQFMGVLRNSVIPAGYNFVSVVTIVSEMIGGGFVKLIQGTTETPNYIIKYTANEKFVNFGQMYGKPLGSKYHIFANFANRNMSFADWDISYKFDKISDIFFNVDSFDPLDISFLGSYEYYNTNVYELSTLQTKVNKSVKGYSTTNTLYNKSEYNIKYSNGAVNNTPSTNSNYNIHYEQTHNNTIMSFYDFDLKYKFTKWADTFFNLNDFDDIEMSYFDSEDYFNQIVYNKITTPTSVVVE